MAKEKRALENKFQPRTRKKDATNPIYGEKSSAEFIVGDYVHIRCILQFSTLPVSTAVVVGREFFFYSVFSRPPCAKRGRSSVAFHTIFTSLSVSKKSLPSRWNNLTTKISTSIYVTSVSSIVRFILYKGPQALLITNLSSFDSSVPGRSL